MQQQIARADKVLSHTHADTHRLWLHLASFFPSYATVMLKFKFLLTEILIVWTHGLSVDILGGRDESKKKIVLYEHIWASKKPPKYYNLYHKIVSRALFVVRYTAKYACDVNVAYTARPGPFKLWWQHLQFCKNVNCSGKYFDAMFTLAPLPFAIITISIVGTKTLFFNIIWRVRLFMFNALLSKMRSCCVQWKFQHAQDNFEGCLCIAHSMCIYA